MGRGGAASRRAKAFQYPTDAAVERHLRRHQKTEPRRLASHPSATEDESTPGPGLAAKPAPATHELATGSAQPGMPAAVTLLLAHAILPSIPINHCGANCYVGFTTGVLQIAADLLQCAKSAELGQPRTFDDAGFAPL
jgi:hypothetical protein